MSDTVRVKFVTKVAKYVLPRGDFDISTSLNRKGLSDALNQVFSLDPHVPFDFKISGNFLRTTLAQAIRLYQLSTEQAIKVEFFPAMKPPIPGEEQKTDDWISCIKVRNQQIYYTLYNGTFHFGETTLQLSENNNPSLKSFSFLGENKVVCGSIDGNATIFDLSGSATPKLLQLHNSSINSVATNETTEHLFITGGSDSCVSMWSTSEGSSLLSPFVGHQDAVQEVSWDNPSRLTSCSLDRTLRTWDVNTQQETGLLSATCGVLCLSVKGDLVLTGHPDRSIRLWDMRSNERRTVIGEFKAHNNWISSVSWIRDDVFASASYDGSVKLWNVGTPIPLYTISQQDEKVFTIGNENGHIAFGGTGQIIRKYTIENEEY